MPSQSTPTPLLCENCKQPIDDDNFAVAMWADSQMLERGEGFFHYRCVRQGDGDPMPKKEPKRFTLKADAVIMATDIGDAFWQLSRHFQYLLLTLEDDEGEGEDPQVIASGTIELKPEGT